MYLPWYTFMFTLYGVFITFNNYIREKKMHRLYFLMPDITVTHNLVNELLLSHVEERHIHVIAKEGTPMEELP